MRTRPPSNSESGGEVQEERMKKRLFCLMAGLLMAGLLLQSCATMPPDKTSSEDSYKVHRGSIGNISVGPP